MRSSSPPTVGQLYTNYSSMDEGGGILNNNNVNNNDNTNNTRLTIQHNQWNGGVWNDTTAFGPNHPSDEEEYRRANAAHTAGPSTLIAESLYHNNYNSFDEVDVPQDLQQNQQPQRPSQQLLERPNQQSDPKSPSIVVVAGVDVDDKSPERSSSNYQRTFVVGNSVFAGEVASKTKGDEQESDTRYEQYSQYSQYDQYHQVEHSAPGSKKRSNNVVIGDSTKPHCTRRNKEIDDDSFGSNENRPIQKLYGREAAFSASSSARPGRAGDRGLPLLDGAASSYFDDDINNNDHSEDVRYRGFTTSIRDMYLNPDHERTDCCALTCCGMLQADRDQYLLTGKIPPNVFKRCTMHILLPLTLFIAAGVGAMHVQPKALNEIFCVTLLLSLIGYLIMQCVKGRKKRLAFRKDLLRTKYQILQQQRNINSNQLTKPRNNSRSDHDMIGPRQCTRRSHTEGNRRSVRNRKMYNSEDYDDDDDEDLLLGQSIWDIHCAHPCCLLGCYADDKHKYHDQTTSKDKVNTLAMKKSSVGDHIVVDRSAVSADLFSKLLNMVLNPVSCCCCCCGSGIMMMSAIQCCGVCGIAQEAREVDRFILPPKYRRIDYITMEPFLQYYPAIYNRHEQLCKAATNHTIDSNSQLLEDNNQQHQRHYYWLLWVPVSRLSYRLVQTLIAFLLLLLMWVYLAPYYWTYIMHRSTEHIEHMFGIWDYCVLLATFGHAFLLLGCLVYYTNNHHNKNMTTASSSSTTEDRTTTEKTTSPIVVPSRLSLDAIIKFFATGFFLSASLAFFWEVVSVLVVDTLVTIILALVGIDRNAVPAISTTTTTTFSDMGGDDYDDWYYRGSVPLSSRHVSTNTVWNPITSYHLTHIVGSTSSHNGIISSLLSTLLGNNQYLSTSFSTMDESGNGQGNNDSSSSKDYMDVFGMDHPIWYTLYLAVGAFIVAALIEELCKYFGFRMAEEHPDFLSSKELHDAAIVYRARLQQQEVQSQYSTCGSDRTIHRDGDDDYEYDDGGHEDQDENEVNIGVNHSVRTSKDNDNRNTISGVDGGCKEASFDFPNQLRSVQAHAAAITLAMVATAIGFSCCENLIYVFIYAGTSVSLEIGVLIERSFFPLHPIAAAIQSIGVCQCLLEQHQAQLQDNKNGNNKDDTSIHSQRRQQITSPVVTTRMGDIVLPAILLHGSFDFFILWIDFLGKYRGIEPAEEGDLEITDVNELLSVLSCVIVMMVGLVYYFIRSNQQREQLVSWDNDQRRRQHKQFNRKTPSETI